MESSSLPQYAICCSSVDVVLSGDVYVVALIGVGANVGDDSEPCRTTALPSFLLRAAFNEFFGFDLFAVLRRLGLLHVALLLVFSSCKMSVTAPVVCGVVPHIGTAACCKINCKLSK